MKSLFCLIVEDEPLAQEVLETYIGRLDELQLVCKCESAEEAYEVIKSHHIDIIFLDLNLGADSGLDLVRWSSNSIKRYYLIITSSEPPYPAGEAITPPSDSFVLVDHLTKPFSFNQFKHSIEKISQL